MNEIRVSNASILGGTIKISGYQDDGYYQALIHGPAAELELLTLISSLVPPGATIVDVGANIGFVSIATAKIAGPKSKVYSFEPSPKNYKLLLNNIRLNKLGKNIKPYGFGLSDSAKKFKLLYSKDNRGGAFIAGDIKANEVYKLEEEIQTKSLDSISKTIVTKCDFMKVDIEGHEPSFLRGAKKFINTNKPACIMEANHWCLNVFSNTTMPQYLKQLYAIFPFVYAFDSQEIINVREHEMYFMHENLVHMRFQNVYCDFDSQRVNLTVANYLRFLRSDKTILEQQNNRIEQQSEEITRLKSELDSVNRSLSHRTAAKMNRLIGR